MGSATAMAAAQWGPSLGGPQQGQGAQGERGGAASEVWLRLEPTEREHPGGGAWEAEGALGFSMRAAPGCAAVEPGGAPSPWTTGPRLSRLTTALLTASCSGTPTASAKARVPAEDEPPSPSPRTASQVPGVT